MDKIEQWLTSERYGSVIPGPPCCDRTTDKLLSYLLEMYRHRFKSSKQEEIIRHGIKITCKECYEWTITETHIKENNQLDDIEFSCSCNRGG